MKQWYRRTLTKVILLLVGVISGAAFFIAFVMDNIINTQAQKAEDLPHPLGITFGQIVIDGNNVDAFALKSI